MQSESNIHHNGTNNLVERLHQAISKGSVEDVRYWLELGANPETSTDQTENAIIHSMLVKRHDVFAMLVEQGVSLESTFYYEKECTPLMYAMEQMVPITFVKTLLNHGANIHVCNDTGSVIDNFLYYRSCASPRMWTSQDEVNVLKLLIKAGHPVREEHVRKSDGHLKQILMEALPTDP